VKLFKVKVMKMCILLSTLGVSWKKCGKHMFFAEVLGRKNVVCFRDFCNHLVSDAWYCFDDNDDTVL